MPLTKLQFKAGINRENTSYSNEGGWYDCDKVRFRYGVPEKIGGWVKDNSNTFLGTCRALKAWVTLSGLQLLGIGTNSKYYINRGGDYNDITPTRATTSSGDVNFVATANSETITVTDASHGAVTGDFVSFSSATSTGLGGCITATALNQDFEITKVDANSYTITLGTDSANATVGITLDSSNTVISMVEAASTLPTAAQSAGTVLIGSEKITYTGTSGQTLTGCTRGALSTTAAEHALGTKIILLPNATDAGTNAVNMGSGLNDSATTITLDSTTNFPTAGMIKIGSELITYTGKTSTNITGATRGFGSTAAASHADDAVVTNTGSAIGAYAVQSGLNSTVFGTGWGTDTWGRSTWGSDGTRTISSIMRLWSHDNYGQNLIINIRDGGIYYWDTASDTLGSSRATELKDVSGADSTTPTIAKQVMVADRSRHVICFGCDPQSDIGTQDPMLIRWSDTANDGGILVWEQLVTNEAGFQRLSTGSEIICAVETRLQILIFTDVSLHTMQYVGPSYIFGFELASENITIISATAAKAVGDAVFWMGYEDFYVYDGRVQKLPCSVQSFVFDNFNLDQKDKVFAALNSSHNEIWWFYPTKNSETVDRYIIYNYVEKAWSYGSMNRTAWLDRGIFDYPLATDSNGILYDHENGLDDGSTNPASAISSYIESSQIDLGDGEQFVFLKRLIPDISFNGSTDESPTSTFTLKARNFPGVDYSESNASTITQTQAETSTQVALFTDQAFVRLRGRSFALKVASTDTGIQWRLGTPRVEIRPDGRR
jgi:hypothetical protein